MESELKKLELSNYKFIPVDNTSLTTDAQKTSDFTTFNYRYGLSRVNNITLFIFFKRKYI